MQLVNQLFDAIPCRNEHGLLSSVFCPFPCFDDHFMGRKIFEQEDKVGFLDFGAVA